jgi:hypothetical protein
VAGVLAALLVVTLAVAGVRAAAATRGATTPHGSQATVTLRTVPQGTVVLSWDPASTSLTATLTLTGLAPSSAHAVHLRCPACQATPGGSLVASLDTITANTYGAGTSTTTVAGVTHGMPAEGWVVDVLNGTSTADPLATVRIATADIVNPGASTTQPQKVTVALRGTSDPNQSASGTSHLRIARDTLIATIDLSGLAPNSLHAAHIHAGSCTKQGPIVYSFHDLKADASGRASVTMQFPHVSSIPQHGWYVNVHNGPMSQLANPEAFDPIACGDVVAH